MAGNPKTHVPAMQKLSKVQITAEPYGGYLVSNEGNFPAAAFSTKDELLKWLGANLAEPALQG